MELQPKARLWRLSIHQLKHVLVLIRVMCHVINPFKSVCYEREKKKKASSNPDTTSTVEAKSQGTGILCKFHCWSYPSSVTQLLLWLPSQEPPPTECHQHLPSQPPCSSAFCCSRCQTTTAQSQVARTVLLVCKKFSFLPHYIL